MATPRCARLRKGLETSKKQREIRVLSTANQAKPIAAGQRQPAHATHPTAQEDSGQQKQDGQRALSTKSNLRLISSKQQAKAAAAGI